MDNGHSPQATLSTNEISFTPNSAKMIANKKKCLTFLLIIILSESMVDALFCTKMPHLSSSPNTQGIVSTVNTLSPSFLSASMIDSPLESESDPLVRNFRKAANLTRIYRCANTDPLGTLFQGDSAADSMTTLESFDKNTPEHIILNNAGLILDLRSDSERKELLAQAWMVRGNIETKYYAKEDRRREPSSSYSSNDSSKRFVYRIDVLSPKRLFAYMAQTWITDPVQKAKYAFSAVFDTQKLHEMRMDVLNAKGIQGTYEAMLETSGEELFAALKSITEFLENNDSGDVIVHCVKGKDRTGLVIMLCQAILGIDDAVIVDDYHKSESLLKKREGSAADATVSSQQMQVKGKLNKTFFSGSPEIAMISTLAFVRQKHGSLHNYLDFVGFDASWRKRFITTMDGDQTRRGIKSENTNMVPLQSKL